MRLGDLVGHERPAALLQRSLLNDRVPNAYLFIGEEGIGKGTAATALAQILVCESPDARPAEGTYEACGRCASCRLAEAGNHPHARTISPDGEYIRIEQMRELRHDVALTSFGGTRRAYVLLDAETMTEESANCILKTLEEPPPGVTLILVTPSPAQLLPTIVSRCQVVRFEPAPTSAVEALLVERHGVAPHHARLLADLSGGRAGWAVRLSRHPGILEARERLLHLLHRMPNAEAVYVFRAAEELRLLACDVAAHVGTEAGGNGEEAEAGSASAESRHARTGLDVLLGMARGWFRDLLVLKLAPGLPLSNPDRRSELAEAAANLPLFRIQDALDVVAHTRHAVARNANVGLALEVMLDRLSTGEG